MSLGIALSRFQVISWTKASILGAVRVIIGPIIGFSLIKYLDLDGFAAGVLLISETKATELGLTPLVRIISQASAAQEPEWFTTAPIKAISKVLEKAGMEVADIDLWEINEAFAPVAMAVMDDFNLDHNKVNVNGGDIALGHPIGASGARILTTLIYALKSRDVTTGLATLCIGGGEASALIVERV